MAKKPRVRHTKKEQTALEKNAAETYNHYKEFEGKQYTGMKIGRSHKWYYDRGEWRDKKITPDEWEIDYQVTKRRAGRAPKGSGVPEGSQYHWYIIAHQTVTKLNANDYSTSMTGLKFKLAHKRADKETWSSSTHAQKKKAIKILRGLADQMEKEMEEETNVIPLRPARKPKKKEKKVA